LLRSKKNTPFISIISININKLMFPKAEIINEKEKNDWKLFLEIAKK
jgi:hypothetical protein